MEIIKKAVMPDGTHIQLVGLDAAVFQENENGELIDPICWKDADWISGKPIRARAERFNVDMVEYFTENIIDDDI